MKKRIISIVLVLTMIAGLLTVTGCGRKAVKKTVDLGVLEKVDEELEEIVLGREFQDADEKERLEIAKKAVSQLIVDKLIKKDSVQIHEEEGAVVFEYEGGGTGTIHTGDLPKPSESEQLETSEKPVVQEAVDKKEEQAKESGATVVKPDEEIPVVDDEEGKWSKQPDPVVDVVITPKPSKLRIRVYNAFEDNYHRNSNYEFLVSTWLNAGFTEDQIVLDNEVYVEELLEITDYSMVSFSMHGSVSRNLKGNVVPTILLMDDGASDNRNAELSKYLANYEVAKVYTSEGTCYSVNPAFFENNLDDNALGHTVVYSESCEFFGRCSGAICDRYSDIYCGGIDLTFGDVFYNKSCPAIMGFHNSVSSGYAIDGLRIFGITLNLGYTPEYAYCAFMEIRDIADCVNEETGLTAYPILVGKNITCTIADLLEADAEEPATNPEETVPEVTEPVDNEEHSMYYFFEGNDYKTQVVDQISVMASHKYNNMGYGYVELSELPCDVAYWVNYALDKYSSYGKSIYDVNVTEDWIDLNGEYFEYYFLSDTDEEVCDVKEYLTGGVYLNVEVNPNGSFYICYKCSNIDVDLSEFETEYVQEETEPVQEESHVMLYTIKGDDYQLRIVDDVFVMSSGTGNSILELTEPPCAIDYWVEYALDKCSSNGNMIMNENVTEDWIDVQGEELEYYSFSETDENGYDVVCYQIRYVTLSATIYDDGSYYINFLCSD